MATRSSNNDKSERSQIWNLRNFEFTCFLKVHEQNVPKTWNPSIKYHRKRDTRQLCLVDLEDDRQSGYYENRKALERRFLREGPNKWCKADISPGSYLGHLQYHNGWWPYFQTKFK